MMRLQITVGAGYLAYEKVKLRAVMRAAGAEVATRARSLIRGGVKGRTSVPGGPPVSRTGTLAASIKVRPSQSGESVTIRDSAYYALFLESGARGGGGDARPQNLHRTRTGRTRMKKSAINKDRILLPRPFLSTALDQAESAGLAARIGASIGQDIKFVRTEG
jgi:hypothetical protein